MDSTKVTRLELHTVILESRGASVEMKKNSVLRFLYEKFHLGEDRSLQNLVAVSVQKFFFPKYFQKWEECRRMDNRFQRRHREWLEQEIKFPVAIFKCLTEMSRAGTPEITRGGRPLTPFEKASERSKRRKTEKLRSSTSKEELCAATSMQLRATGDDAAAKIVKEVTTTTPTRAKRILSKWRRKDISQTELSGEEAISLIVTGHLTKAQYMLIRETARNHGHNIYPSYDQIKLAKSAAYPAGISISEEKCEVNLQSLLNHTASRIISSLKLLMKDCPNNPCILICKWGFDGSSGHSQYKQTCEKPNVRDESLFATSLVPLHLVDTTSGESVWSNPRPSSTRFCRPIRIQWSRKTREVSVEEERYISEQIKNLRPIQVDSVLVTFRLLLTMIDGKVCNALAETSSMKCYLCGAKISQMNDLDKMRKMKVDESKYSFGLSVLHCYIRFFECLIHISYRLEIKKWKMKSTDGSKQAMEKRKKFLQDEFRTRMGLLVDHPKPGFGTTNDGNTARRFFGSPELSAEITGIDQEIIIRFATILKAISSDLKINEVAFTKYCCSTAEMYVNLYSWYFMPPTVHKVLIHGAAIIKDAIIPIGQLSEEALEARNKDIRRFRERHSRKTSRLATNHDLFHRLLLTSDPYISCTSTVGTKTKKKIPDQVSKLLLTEETDANAEFMSEEDSESDLDFEF